MKFLLILTAITCASAQGVSFSQEAGRVHVQINGQDFTSFHYSSNYAKPFLQPIRSAGGKEVTRAFPLAQREGEHTDHPHHRGLWWGHGDINGIDFWLEKDPSKTGRLVIKGQPVLTPDAITSEFDLVQPDGKSLGTVTQSYLFSSQKDHRFIDVTITLKADKNQNITFGDSEEGTMGLRLRDEFRQDRGATPLNSTGMSGTERIWGKRAQWVDYSGTVEGQKMGVAVFDHPSNPKHPTYWHARPYGLLAANAFGERDFYNDKTRNGSLTINAGQSLRFRYRYMIHNGNAENAHVADQYHQWAHRKKHVVVIGIDGLGAEGVLSSSVPRLEQLKKSGSWTLKARSVIPTVSSPNWASMIMGAGPAQHGITSNEWQPFSFEIEPVCKGSAETFPTVFGILREQRPSSKIGIFHHWSGFGRLLEKTAPSKIMRFKTETETMNAASEYWATEKPDLLFIHLDHVDHAGHHYGWKSSEYQSAVLKADELVGQMFDVIQKNGIDDETVLLISADHGGMNKGHGGNTMAELEIPWIVSGSEIRQDHEITTHVNIYDTAATVAHILGITSPSCWIAKPVVEILETR